MDWERLPLVPLCTDVRAYCSHVKIYCKRVRLLSANPRLFIQETVMSSKLSKEAYLWGLYVFGSFFFFLNRKTRTLRLLLPQLLLLCNNIKKKMKKQLLQCPYRLKRRKCQHRCPFWHPLRTMITVCTGVTINLSHNVMPFLLSVTRK